MKDMKILSFVLALAVMLSVAVLPVYATTPEEDAYNNAMDTLVSVLSVSAFVVIILAVVIAVTILVVKKKKRG